MSQRYATTGKLLFVLVLISLSTGCSYSAAAYTADAPTAYPGHASAAGALFGAEAIGDPDRAEELFGYKLVFKRRYVGKTTYGYIPVALSMHNDGFTPWRIDKEATRLISGDGKRSRPRSWLRMYGTFHPSVVGAYVAGGIVGAVAQDAANEDMATDWREKELPDDFTLFPDGRGAGFLYFKDKGGLGDYRLVLALENPMTGERRRVEIPFGPIRGEG